MKCLTLNLRVERHFLWYFAWNCSSCCSYLLYVKPHISHWIGPLIFCPKSWNFIENQGNHQQMDMSTKIQGSILGNAKSLNKPEAFVVTDLCF